MEKNNQPKTCIDSLSNSSNKGFLSNLKKWYTKILSDDKT